MPRPSERLARWGAILAGMLLIVTGSGCGRSGAEREANAEAQASQQESATPSWMPAFSSMVSLRPGQVKSILPGVSGPFQVRVIVNARQKVSFGLVPKSEVGNYTSPRQVENAMEHLPCGSGGVGALSRLCELGAQDKDFLLVVADLRDLAQASRDMFDDK